MTKRWSPKTTFNLTETIPWSNVPNTSFNFTEAPRVNVWLGKLDSTGFETSRTTASRQLIVDTGTCGIAMATSNIDNWTPNEATAENEGYQYLTSSKLLYVGHWVVRNVYYNLELGGQEIRSQVKILAINKSIKCPKYVLGVDKRNCSDPNSTVIDNPKTALMGIGFGRAVDGKEQGTPDKNPLLNIAEVRNMTALSPKFRPGYVISPTGLTVGLTSTNTFDNWRSVNLPLPPPNTETPGLPEHLRQWGEMQGCVSVNNTPAPCLQSSILLDTGVEQSYIRVPGDPADPSTWPFTWPTHLRGATEPPLSASSRFRLLDNGQSVVVSFGNPPVAEQRYVSGDFGEQVAPIWINNYHDPVRMPFVNTGRHIYRKWKVRFDPVRGTLSFACI